MWRRISFCVLSVAFPACIFAAATTATIDAKAAWLASSLTAEEQSTAPVMLDAANYAVFHTTDGDFICKLLEKQAPKTVDSFIGIATGRKRWKHPITLAESSKPLYDNTMIYEIARDIWIRGGDPIDKGIGDPGFTLEPEISQEVRFDAPGMLAMQGNATRSNGSRWFVSLKPFPDWNGRYTIFGKVVGGLDVVRAISRKATKRPSVPLDPTMLNSVEIVNIPPGKKTTASFSIEEGKKVLGIDKNFAEDPATAVVEKPKFKIKEGQTTASAAESSTQTVAGITPK